jgi:hypothetical protein
MGHVVETASGNGRIAFETDAAVQTSQQIVRELLRDTD